MDKLIGNPNYFGYPHSIIDAKDGDYRKWTKWKRHLKRSVFHRSKIFIESTGEFAVFCGICKGILDYKTATIDHIIPLSKGGNSFITNLQLTHADCNMRKDAIPSKNFWKNQGMIYG